MLETSIIWLSGKSSMREYFIVIDITFEFTCHTEIVDKEGTLINVLKEAEPSILQRKLESVFEVFMRIDTNLFRLFSICSFVRTLTFMLGRLPKI